MQTIKSAQFFGFGTDGWADRKMRELEGSFVQFIDRDWRMHCVIISFQRIDVVHKTAPERAKYFRAVNQK